MDDDELPQLTDIEKDALEWVRGGYFSGVHALMDSNRTYLNQGISWSIGILTAVLIFGLTYIAPLQELRTPEGDLVGRSPAAILVNITDADILLLTAVLSLSFAFVANFMSRSIKGYLNLMRYVGLYSSCLGLVTSGERITAAQLRDVTGAIKQYDEDFCPPLRLRTAFWKMISELGYGLFIIILVILYAAAAVVWHVIDSTLWYWLFWGVLAIGPLWLLVELHFLKSSHYFSFKNYTVGNWPEAYDRK